MENKTNDELNQIKAALLIHLVFQVVNHKFSLMIVK